MAEIDTAQFYIDMLSKLDPNEKVAIPFVWFKADVEEVFEIKLDDDKWAWIVKRYINDEYFNETSFYNLSEYVADVTREENR